jgi:competence protein ComEC
MFGTQSSKRFDSIRYGSGMIFDSAAFAEDCTRADIIVTSRFAPIGCATKIVIDRERFKQTLTLSFKKDGRVEMRAARAPDENRPWSPAPKRGWGRAAPQTPAKDEARQFSDEEPETSDEAFSVN